MDFYTKQEYYVKFPNSFSYEQAKRLYSKFSENVEIKEPSKESLEEAIKENTKRRNSEIPSLKR
jgi:hypothetical protein